MKLVNFHIKVSLLSLALCALLLAGQAWGANWFVRLTDGSDSNNGQTSSTPYASIEKIWNGGNLNFATNDTITLMCPAGQTSCTFAADGSGWWVAADSLHQLNTGYTNEDTAGIVTIQPYTGHTVTLDVPTNTDNMVFKMCSNITIKKGIKIRNSTEKAVYFFNVDQNRKPSSVVIEDADIDWKSPNRSLWNASSDTTSYNVSIYIDRGKITSSNATPNNDFALLRGSLGSGRTASMRLHAVEVTGIGYLFAHAYPGAGSNYFEAINCTFSGIKKDRLILNNNESGLDTRASGKFVNNIFYTDSTFASPLHLDDNTYASIAANWTITNNDFYRALTVNPGLEHEVFCTTNSDLCSLAASNFYVDPQFNNRAGGDYTIVENGANIRGRGNNSEITGTDSAGNAWTGSDIGAYANPVGAVYKPAITVGTIAYIGDSIAFGASQTNRADGWPLTVVGSDENCDSASPPTCAAVGGSGGMAMKAYVDRAALAHHPQYIVLLSWHNNLSATGISPANLTSQQAADDTIIAVAKAKYWGMTPIVISELGTKAANGAGQYTIPAALNTLLSSGCVTNTTLFCDALGRMRFNATWMNAFNSSGTEGYYGATGLSGDVHPNTVGYRLVNSAIEDRLRSRPLYFVADTAVSVVGSTVSPATYRFPQLKTQYNAVDDGFIPDGTKAREKGKYILDEDDMLPKYYKKQ